MKHGPSSPALFEVERDGRERAKVVGTARYAADMHRPGTLVGRTLRSPMPHAEIVSIDVAAARELPGVHAVLTGADLRDVRVGRAIRDMPVLARDRVRFVGEKVAAVAAESTEVAEEALSLIEVSYRELEAVFDPFDAIAPDAPLIHDPELIRAWAAPKQVVPADHPNGVSQLEWGVSREEVEHALESADHLIEHTFRVRPQHQAYLEPHACLVELDDQEVAHIWATNKAPFLLSTYLEQGLGLRRDQLQIHLMPLGGDFGGKGSFMDIPLAYYLARATRRPVKMVMSYTEEMTAGNPRHAAAITITSGIQRDGRIVARLVKVYFASGGYAAFKPSPDAALPEIKIGAKGAYDISALRIEAEMVYTNTVPSGHMRNPGEAQTAYAVEAHTELVARQLGIDSIELRRRNATNHPRAGNDGSMVSPRIGELLDAATEAIGWEAPRRQGTGRGIALSELATSPGIYSAALEVRTDGSVVFHTPIIENGAGMLRAFGHMVAEELRIPPDVVTVVQSFEFTFDRGVGGSRVTRVTGILVERLTKSLHARVVHDLAARHREPDESVTIHDGVFRRAGGETQGLLEAVREGGADVRVDLMYEATPEDSVIVHSVQAAEVEVDPDTGAVRPLRVVAVHEAGRIINRRAFEGQIEGGIVQGLGYALMEGLILEDGRVTNVNLHEYKIPAIEDVPPLETIVLVDKRLGITPIGEGTVGMAAAIANAVVDVVGTRPLDLPITPEALLSLDSNDDSAPIDGAS